MSRLGTVGTGAGAAAPAPGALDPARASEGVGAAAPLVGREARRERALEGAEALSVSDALATALLDDAAETLADPTILRPAGVRAVLEALQADLAAMQADQPEDLLEIALGLLEDEIANAERLHTILQRRASR